MDEKWFRKVVKLLHGINSEGIKQSFIPRHTGTKISVFYNYVREEINE